jgi:CHRD domain
VIADIGGHARRAVATLNEEVGEMPRKGRGRGFAEGEEEEEEEEEEVCFALELQRLDPVTAGHIHKGTANDAGPIKVTLFEDAQGLEADPGSYDRCVKKVKKKLVRKIGKKPEKYYVNVHNPEYPEGAIRGQLKLATAP